MASNTRFAVALHILGLLASKGVAVKSSNLAKSVGTNPVVVRRVLGRLADAGIVESRRGPDGGTTLARHPSKITLLEIYEATASANLIEIHPVNRRCSFARRTRRGLEELVQQAESAVEAELAGLTLADGLGRMGA